MNQSLQEIEIIVVDGGSTDGTLELLNELCMEDLRIILLSQKGSVGAQFNLALKNVHLREYELLRMQLVNRNLWNAYKYAFLSWEIGSYKQFTDGISVTNKEPIVKKYMIS